MADKYNLQKLQELMVEHGLVIRTIPKTITSTCEARHANLYPTGVIKYLPEYKRKMLVVTTHPEHGGQVIITQCKHTQTMVKFNGDRYFDDIQSAVDYMLEKIKQEKK